MLEAVKGRVNAINKSKIKLVKNLSLLIKWNVWRNQKFIYNN